MHHFGAGIVRTPSDFGFRGRSTPRHPELLDLISPSNSSNQAGPEKLHRLMMTVGDLPAGERADNQAARKIDPANQLYIGE